MNNLAQAYKAAGKLDLALPLFEQALARAAGKLDLALPLYEQTCPRARQSSALTTPTR